ncbi:MAG: protein translocase subunit SecF [Alphaproteobacteria bacterium]|nr:protein translocase subunit SecF [Alphaproteobacteria bacterium]
MKFYPLRITSDNMNIPFMEVRSISFGISSFLSLISIVLTLWFGLNLGIDFTGGIVIEAKIPEAIEIGLMRESLTKLNIGEISLQTSGTENEIMIKIGQSKGVEVPDVVSRVKNALQSLLGKEIIYKKIDFVGPQVGAQLIWSGTQALTLCFIGIMIYVAVRFEWQFGVGVLIALIHDVILSVGFMSLTQLDFSLSSIAALLTIIGYSVNDSVVIYDRVRENLRKYRKKTIEEIINISTNETLSRTTMTVITTLIANLALIIWGGRELRSFSILVFFGISAGTYSSIFISAPILKVLGLNRLTSSGSSV